MAIAINRSLPGADPELHVSHGGAFGASTSWLFARLGFFGVVASRRPVRARMTFERAEFTAKTVPTPKTQKDGKRSGIHRLRIRLRLRVFASLR